MKILCTLLALGFLSSCNTLIGMGRDTREGYDWTKRKIQESNQPKHDPYGAPVY